MDERAAQRVATDLQVEAQSAGKNLKVFLVDLSQNGCLINTGWETLEKDVSFQIKLSPEIVASGQVVWVRDRHVGVRFDEQVHEAVVLNLGFKPTTKVERFKDAFGRRLPQQTKFA